MTPKEARRQAHLKFGAVEAVRADCHAEKGLPFVEDLCGDVRYARRVLWKSPAFTLVALIDLVVDGQLSVSIGSNCAKRALPANEKACPSGANKLRVQRDLRPQNT
jgi:hypothetical protein